MKESTASALIMPNAEGPLTRRYAEFKVVGNASVHLSGYYMPEEDEGKPSRYIYRKALSSSASIPSKS